MKKVRWMNEFNVWMDRWLVEWRVGLMDGKIGWMHCYKWLKP
jgi:hypothetical protein